VCHPAKVLVVAAADPEHRANLTQTAELMDARTERLGEHAAACAPPGDPSGR